MSEEDKPGPLSGKTEKIGGTIKKKLGQLIGSERLESEGAAEEVIGKAHEEAYKADQRRQGAVDEVLGVLKGRVGKFVDNEQMEAEGKLKELSGQARQKINQ